MTLHNNLGPTSRALLDCVYAHHRVDADTLHACVPGETRGNLRNRLRHLVVTGWLDSGWTDGGARVWFFPPRARTAWMRGNASSEAIDLVPPRRINVMSGNYDPGLFAPARPGAMDFAAVASRGHRC